MSELFSHMIGDTNFWVAVSTILCFGFIASKAWRPILAGLDQRAVDIAQHLEEARALHAEAQSILDEYQKKSNDAMQEAEQIMRDAEARADKLRIQLEQELKDSIARQEATAKSRIQRMEEEAMRAVKEKLIGATLDQVKQKIANTNIVEATVDHSLDDIKAILKK